jgi:putative transposase
MQWNIIKQQALTCVHLCLAIPPKYSIADAIGKLKGKVTIRGYYVNTIGKNEEQIRQCIKDQDTLDRLHNQGKLFE